MIQVGLGIHEVSGRDRESKDCCGRGEPSLLVDWVALGRVGDCCRWSDGVLLLQCKDEEVNQPRKVGKDSKKKRIVIRK